VIRRNVLRKLLLSARNCQGEADTQGRKATRTVWAKDARINIKRMDVKGPRMAKKWVLLYQNPVELGSPGEGKRKARGGTAASDVADPQWSELVSTQLEKGEKRINNLVDLNKKKLKRPVTTTGGEESEKTSGS